MKIGIVGATGLVGKALIKELETSILPIETLVFYASKNSEGKSIQFKQTLIPITVLDKAEFKGLDLVFFVSTKQISKKYVKNALNEGAIVIDNSNAFRMDSDIPLVVPEVNIESVHSKTKLIANPNCSTIQLVVILHALRSVLDIERVDVSTYQSVSGSGKLAIDEYESERYDRDGTYKPSVLPVKSLPKHYPIIDNVIPQIDVFEENHYSKEEMKVINESQKILNQFIKMSCTAVRVPVTNAHSESVMVKFREAVDVDAVMNCLNNYHDIVVMDDVNKQYYPMPLFVKGYQKVFVGRIRKDLYDPTILHLWIVADNLLKGAATNARQIAEACYNRKVFNW